MNAQKMNNTTGRAVISVVISLIMLFGVILQLLVVPGQVSAAPGVVWEPIDGGGLSADASANSSSRDPSIATWNNHLYAAWSHQKGGFGQPEIRVMQWDGSDWSPADDGSGLNFGSNSSASNPSLAVYKGCLYAIWSERTSSSVPQIRVKKNCGDGGGWVSTSGNDPVSGSGRGEMPVLLVDHDDLYATWIGTSDGSPGRKIQVKKFDGSVWTNEAVDMTFVPNGTVFGPRLAVYQDELYLTWSEQMVDSPYYSYIPVMKRTVNGAGKVTWANVSGNSGITNTTTSAGSPVLQAYNGLLYAVWRDNNPAQLKVSSFDGSVWSPVGSGNLDKPAGAQSQAPNLFVYNQKLVAIWNNVNSQGFQWDLQVQEYDGTNWSPADQGLADTNLGNVTSFATLNNAMYLAWSDVSKIYVSERREPPAAPTGLQAVAGNKEAELSWNLGNGVANYKIYQGTASGVYGPDPITTVDGTTGHYKVQGLEGGKTYYFVVTAVNGNGESSFSVEASAQLTKKLATVSYVPGDHGTISRTSEQVEIGGHPASVPTVTPDEGYHFAGWSSDGGITKLSGQEVAASPVTADVTYTAYYTAFVMGDADGDGKVTAADALLLSKYIKGKITLTPEQLQALDMNGDGKWDDEDVKAILAVSVGKG
ncbi:dockerin type I domain-containing protein [Paenibacillus sp. Y412MC10]|uniref:dockerin type I domain-containing protein n=1 Tax=Geobacillus sp. (strain Y412MC10) TaxID=481743 RepID=UPI0021B3F5B3|nr:dockerin type I domain-containing protein [Paenibacillus sp. Y412MC10]